MTVREIITVPHPNLKRKARRVTAFDSDLHTLIDDMLETMRAAPGTGLAAPQVDVPLRVIVIEYAEIPEVDEDEEPPQVKPDLYIVVNPEIKRASIETVLGFEGCLSIPGFVGEVERAQSVTVIGQNRHGQDMKIKADGWLARVFQHEVDHLDGILYTDHTDKLYQLDEQGEIAE
jgi:peptide deformylase